MIGKILGIVTIAAVVFSYSGVAFAKNSHHHDDHNTVTPTNISISNTDTDTYTVAGSIALTGVNGQTGSCLSHQDLHTGSITSVSSLAMSEVNTTEIPACTNCTSHNNISVKNSDVQTVTVAISGAVSGVNGQTAGGWAHQDLHTGSVTGVASQATSLVNYVDMSVN